MPRFKTHCRPTNFRAASALNSATEKSSVRTRPNPGFRPCLSTLAAGSLLVSSATLAQCPDYTTTRAPFFGDLHSHSSYSFDAFTAQTRNDPWDAYAFAKQERGLPLTPLESGQPTQELWIDRPLDFAAVTDHSELLGLLTRKVNTRCSYEGRDCPHGQLRAWHNIQQAASDNYAECRFTTFVAYEYSKQQFGDPGAATDVPLTLTSMLHRNVIFRNAQVTPQPYSSIDVSSPEKLWRKLDQKCIKAGTGCDVLAIPHNSNLSNGFMFPDYSSTDDALERAVLQRRFEPLVEITQHKGASECQYGEGLSSDEECGFENIAGFAIGGGVDAQKADPAYVRNAMKTGLQMNASLGINPYQMGFIGSSDNHNSTPGAVSEDGWKGHLGIVDDTTEERLSADGQVTNNPGGLAVVWAEENSRDAIFNGLRRRETYATSGPRMVVRVFGGWTLPKDLCDQPQWLQTAYKEGVPMGGDLGHSPTGKAPIFVISALKDSAGAAHNLERVQIIKGWTDLDGTAHEQVYDVYGNKVPTESVNTASCTVAADAGFASVCTGWIDPDFDPAQNAFYYSRVLEVPSCRWSQLEANQSGYPAPTVTPATIRERAWTSPIWVSGSGVTPL